MSVLLNIGNLYIEINNMEDALKYYYKVDYLSKSSPKKKRQIAWCEFLLNNYKQSETYYNKIEDSNKTAQDYLNLGHLSVAKSNMKEAISYYIKSVKTSNINISNFINEFYQDSKYLISKGVDKEIFPLIIDKIRFELIEIDN